MTYAMWFWIAIAAKLVFGFVPVPAVDHPNWRYWNWGGGLLDVILFILLGMGVFGSAVKH